jgi:hypothetical protein
MAKLTSLISKLSQKFCFGKTLHQRCFKSCITRLVLLSFIHQNLAFATNTMIELDFKDSQTPYRLHTIFPSHKIKDVSYVEIDTEKKQTRIHIKHDAKEM